MHVPRNLQHDEVNNMIRTNIAVTLAILAAFALGLSVHTDIEPLLIPKASDTECPAKLHRVEEIAVSMGATRENARALREISQRESSPIKRVPAARPVEEELDDDDELKVIECSQNGGNSVEDCDCWVFGNCDAQKKTTHHRYRGCRDTHRVTRDCQCWVYGEAMPGTVCRLFSMRDECETDTPSYTTPEECLDWVNQEGIPNQLGW